MVRLCLDRSGDWGGWDIVWHSVKALIISALLVLVAWLRWKANTGSPPLPSRTLSIEGGSVPGLNAGGPFSWKWLGHCGVSGALTIWRHIYKAFTCLTKAQTELRPKTPLFTCSFFVFWNIPFRRPPSPQTNRHPTAVACLCNITALMFILQQQIISIHKTKTKSLSIMQINITLTDLFIVPCNNRALDVLFHPPPFFTIRC